MYQAFGEVYWLLAEFDVPIWLMGVFSQEIGGVDKTTTSGQRQKKTSHLGVEKSQILISFSLLYFHSSGPPYLNLRFSSVCRRPSCRNQAITRHDSFDYSREPQLDRPPTVVSTANSITLGILIFLFPRNELLYY